MELRIEPEPGPRERVAIERALKRLLLGDRMPRVYASRWRRSGLDFAEELYATARPRRRRGATRA